MISKLAAATIVLFATNAYAVDWAADEPGVPIYSNSLLIDAEDFLDISADALTVTGVITDNNIPADLFFSVTLSLNNGASFVQNPAFTLKHDGDDDITFYTYNSSDSSSVVLRGRNGDAATSGDVTYAVDITSLNVVNYDEVELSIFVEVSDEFGTDTYFTGKGPLLKFGDSFEIETDLSVEPPQIDVTQKSLFFYGEDDGDIYEGETSVELGDIDINWTALLDADSTAIDSKATIIKDELLFTVEAENGFSAADQEGDATGFSFDANYFIIDGTIAAAQAEFYWFAGTPAYFEVPEDNQVPIEPTGFLFSLAGEAQPGFHADQFNVRNLPLHPLVKNGSEARLTFALMPGGAFPYFVRITNPSENDGIVTLRLINDRGEKSSPIVLGDIEGIDSDFLAAGASTGLLSIDKIYAATTRDFEHHGGKLRIDVNAEFGKTGQLSGVVLNAFSLGANGISMMTAVD